MKLKKKLNLPAKDVSEYLELITQIEAEITRLTYQLESQTTNRLTHKLVLDLEYDAVPIIRKLKEAQKLAKDSINYFSLVR